MHQGDVFPVEHDHEFDFFSLSGSYSTVPGRASQARKAAPKVGSRASGQVHASEATSTTAQHGISPAPDMDMASPEEDVYWQAWQEHIDGGLFNDEHFTFAEEEAHYPDSGMQAGLDFWGPPLLHAFSSFAPAANQSMDLDLDLDLDLNLESKSPESARAPGPKRNGLRSPKGTITPESSTLMSRPPSVAAPPPRKRPAEQLGLQITFTRFKSRVETQIPMRVVLSSLPHGVTKLHLPTYTISKPSFLARPHPAPSPDTLELSVSLVCSSAMRTEEQRETALKRAAAQPVGFIPDVEAVQPLPRDGGEVRICAACIDRERKRIARNKTKHLEEEGVWAQHEKRRVVFFNASEIQLWKPKSEDVKLPENYDPANAVQIDIPTRIACYCRHHEENAGFQMILTIKDHKNRLVAQEMSFPIMITDSHKATTPTQAEAHLPKKKPTNWINATPTSYKDLRPSPDTQPGVRFSVPESTRQSSEEESVFESDASTQIQLPNKPNWAIPEPQARSLKRTRTEPEPFDALSSLPVTPQSNVGPPLNAEPFVHKIIPNTASLAGGTEVVCLGRGFFQGLEIWFGEQKATTTTYWGDSTLVCLVPPSTTEGPVEITLGYNMLGSAMPVKTRRQPPEFSYSGIEVG